VEEEVVKIVKMQKAAVAHGPVQDIVKMKITKLTWPPTARSHVKYAVTVQVVTIALRAVQHGQGTVNVTRTLDG